MDLIYAKNGVELGVIKKSSFDCDLNDGNDFSLIGSYENYNPYLITLIDHYIYLENTEYGGLITNRKINKQSKTVELKGLTFRGYLETKIVIVPDNQDYYVVDGDLKTVVKQLFEDCHMPNDWLVDKVENINVNYQFNRYCTLKKALDDLCSKYSLKMHFYYKNGVHFSLTRNKTKNITISSEDMDNIKISVSQKKDYPTGMIALGKGELKDREVRYLMLVGDEVKEVNKDFLYDGINIITYENSSSDNLLEDAKKKFSELIENLNHGFISNVELLSFTKDIKLNIDDQLNLIEPILNLKIKIKVNGLVIKKKDEELETVEYKFSEVIDE